MHLLQSPALQFRVARDRKQLKEERREKTHNSLEKICFLCRLDARKVDFFFFDRLLTQSPALIFTTPNQCILNASAHARAQREPFCDIFLPWLWLQNQRLAVSAAARVSPSAPLLPSAAENFLRSTSERFALVRRICKKSFFDFSYYCKISQRGS